MHDALATASALAAPALGVGGPALGAAAGQAAVAALAARQARVTRRLSDDIHDLVVGDHADRVVDGAQAGLEHGGALDGRGAGVVTLGAGLQCLGEALGAQRAGDAELAHIVGDEGLFDVGGPVEVVVAAGGDGRRGRAKGHSGALPVLLRAVGEAAKGGKLKPGGLMASSLCRGDVEVNTTRRVMNHYTR